MIPESGTLTNSDIDFQRISTNSSDALSQNFLSDVSNFWRENGELTYEISDNGATLIKENGTAMGWTDIEGIAKIISNVDKRSIDDNDDEVIKMVFNDGSGVMIGGTTYYVEDGKIIANFNNGNQIVYSEDGRVEEFNKYQELSKITYPNGAERVFRNNRGSYLCDSEGNIIYGLSSDNSITARFPHDGKVKKIMYDYHYDGGRSEEYVYNDGSIVDVEYDSTGTIKQERLWLEMENVKNNNIMTEYDSDGKLAKENFYKREGNAMWEEVYEYDSNGNLISDNSN